MTNHATLDVHTHMGKTVFFEPVPARAKTVYVGVRNTSDYPDFDVRMPLMQANMARGYAIVDDPDTAHYRLQANVLRGDPDGCGPPHLLAGQRLRVSAAS